MRVTQASSMQDLCCYLSVLSSVFSAYMWPIMQNLVHEAQARSSEKFTLAPRPRARSDSRVRSLLPLVCSARSTAAMSLSQHVSKVVEASGRKSLLSFIFSMEGLKMFADGNVG